LTAYNTIALNNIGQFKLVGTPFGSSTVYLDNIYFYKNPPTAPLVAAPTPTKPAANVISLFSNAYTNVTGTDWFPNWGQSTIVTDVVIAGNDTKKYANLNYQGVQFTPSINASAMEFVHFDLWTGDCSAFDLFLINTSPATIEQKVTVTPTAFGWNSFDIPLSSYNTIALNNIGQFKLVGTPFGSSNLFLDNIYFHNTPTLSVLATSLTVANAANSTNTIAVASNTAWTATSNQTWLSVSPASGTGTANVVVTAQENLSVSPRTAIVTISAPGLPNKTVTIVQDGAIPAVALSVSTLSIAAPDNSIQTFSVTSNTSWSVTSNQTWLSASQINGSGNANIVLIAQGNPTTNPRVAIITITGLNVAPKTITVTQDGIPATLSVSSNTLSIGAPANSQKTFDVTSNTSWTVVSSQAWLALSSPSGTGNSVITMTALANPTATPRTATVTISATGAADQIITVTQDGAAALLILPVTSLTIAAPANSTKTFNIVSNTTWTVASSATWLTASSATGSANATITLTAQANPTTTTRTATITVTAANLAPQTITVTQDATLPTLAVSATTLSIAAPANSQKTVNVTSNTTWTATSSQTWLALSSASGTNNATLTLTAQANPSTATRTAIVTVSTAGVTDQIITVTQEAAAAILTVSANTLAIAAPANSTKTFNIVANTNWTLVSGANWLAASSASGTTNATITLTAQANPTTTTRTTTIKVSAAGVPDQVVTVTQDAGAAVLTVAANALTVAAPANSTKTFDIVSNTNWTLASSGNWFVATPASGTGNATITITAQANPSPTVRMDTVTISAAGAPNQVILVTQDAAGTLLTVSASTLTIAAPANSTKTFDITSNLAWAVASSETWLTVGTPKGSNNATITLTAQANPTTTTRTATITISGNGVGNQTITVTQDAALPTLAVSATALTIAAPANSTKTFNVTSNTTWTATSNQSWLAVNNATGANNATLTLTAQENLLVATRTATVVLSAQGAADQTITVTQDAALPILSVSTTTVTIAAPANSTGTFDVTANTSWNVSSNATWITLAKTTGSATQITITAQANPSTAPRTTTISVNAPNLPSKIITVTQEGAVAVLTVSATTLKVAASANSTQIFDIASNTAWTVSSDQPWLAVSNAAGTGNAKITLTAQANISNATRNATITVKATGAADKVIVVTQDFMVGTDNLENDLLPFSIYPNPVAENLFIKLQDANTSFLDLKINDLTGKVLMQLNQINLQENINVSTLPSGVYFIQLMDDTTKAVSTRKFVKM
jgi:ribosomal protein L28